jgi:MAF protein
MAEVLPVGVDESPAPGEPAVAMARRLGLAKARAAASSRPGSLSLGADTVVVDGEDLLGKPADAAEVARMLAQLRGKNHQVITGLALIDGETGTEIVDVCETRVPMRNYNDDEVAAYIASGEPMDKAGAYGIQDNGFRPVAVERLDGCYANVMGLPLCHLARSLRALHRHWPEDVPAVCQAHTGYLCRVHRRILRGET